MRSWLTGLAGAAAGAVITAGVFITTPPERQDTAASSPASQADHDRVSSAKIAGAVAAASTLASDRGSGAAGDASERAAEVLLATMTPAELRQRNLALVAENRSLQEKLDAMRDKVASEGSSSGGKETYDLSPEELRQMAQSCELRWDMPSLSYQPPLIADDDAAALALSEGERAIVNEKFADSHARLVEEVQSVYAMLTGDERPGSMSPEAMYAEIIDKVSKEELRAIFQRLSHERAGLMSPPSDLSSVSPVEKMFRVLTSEGQALEQALAQELGPELASSIRDQNNGWSSKFRSTHGCPQ